MRMGNGLRLALAALCAVLLASCARRQPEPFTFGIVADIQYGDKDAAGTRHYRASLGKLERCVADLNGRNLAFTIQLGDIIDGQTRKEDTRADLDRILAVFDRLDMPTYHVVGNHDLTAGREVLQERLGLQRTYYDFTVPQAAGYRFIVLDGNDAGYGVLGEAQLAWLDSTLSQSRLHDERVLVFNHFALVKAAARHGRMRTPEPVLELIDMSDNVIAYFAGHDHAGGYTKQNGIHHVTLKGMVESPDETACAVIEVRHDRIVETGFGAEPSREMMMDQN